MTTKKRFIPQLSNVAPYLEEDFGALLGNFSSDHIKEGLVVKGQVVEVGRDIIVVDVGVKNEGRIAVSEFLIDKESSLPEVGDLVDVYVEKLEGRRGTILSREKALREESWVKLEEMYETATNVSGTIFGRVKGGFTVDIKGVTAFLPGSQVDVRPIKDINSIMNIEQPFKILKMDKKLGNIVVSRKAILEDSRSEERDAMLATVEEGMVIAGVVKNITDYGAFVDLGSVDGLLHVTDISWSRINHPSEVLSLGQEIKVVVIKFNEESKRISLGMKQLESNPWNNLKQEFEIGKQMFGKITNLTDYGAFVEIKEGVEGLVHSSEISWGKMNISPRKILTVGQEVEFIILDVDAEKHRISLSIKRCKPNPLIKFSQEYPVGSLLKTTIRNVTDFGIFVILDENTDGMIHESDLSWDGNGAELLSNYKKGDDIECKVLSIDIEKDRVALGIKQLSEDPYSNLDSYKKGDLVSAVVTEVNNDFIELIIDGTIPAIIKRSDLSSDKEDQKTERFTEGDRVSAKVVSVDRASRKVSLSIKALEIEERQKAIKEHGSADSGANLGDILGAALNTDEKK